MNLVRIETRPMQVSAFCCKPNQSINKLSTFLRYLIPQNNSLQTQNIAREYLKARSLETFPAGAAATRSSPLLSLHLNSSPFKLPSSSPNSIQPTQLFQNVSSNHKGEGIDNNNDASCNQRFRLHNLRRKGEMGNHSKTFHSG